MLHEPQTLKLTMTEKAALKVKEVITKENKKDAALRVFIAGGGCGGFRYGMGLDDKTNDGDHILETRGVKLFVDKDSAQYLEGAEIDYVETVMGEGFMVNNPNAVETCGCGQSFKAGSGHESDHSHDHGTDHEHGSHHCDCC